MDANGYRDLARVTCWVGSAEAVAKYVKFAETIKVIVETDISQHIVPTPSLYGRPVFISNYLDDPFDLYGVDPWRAIQLTVLADDPLNG